MHLVGGYLVYCSKGCDCAIARVARVARVARLCTYEFCVMDMPPLRTVKPAEHGKEPGYEAGF